MATKINHGAIDKVIQRNIRSFRKPGVFTVRPGYKLTGGWITDKPAIVATVDKKLDGLTPNQKLPAEVEDVPVDVREATGMQRLRAADPAAHALMIAHGRNEFREPDWNDERSVSDGKRLPPTSKLRPASGGKNAKKPSLPYSAPPKLPLNPVTRPMTIIAHASPENGYPVLTDFLAKTTSRLTIAMYDFTSGDILNAMKAAISPGSGRPLQMVLDHPPRNPTANQPDDVTAADLMKADKNATVYWALTRNDPKATKWIYPSAYHIKVIVRDGNSFWLSSGNLNVSNQPNLAANDPKRGSLSNADRDWHVVVMDPGLAQLYEAYIKHDFEVASADQGQGNPARRQQIQAAARKHKVEMGKSSHTRVAREPSKPSTLGMQKIFTNVPVTIQPLLTPDPGKLTTLYVDKVLALINSAERSVYMQTQYVHPSDQPVDKDFKTLVEALSDAHRRGLDVRVITSQYENTSQWVEKMHEYELDQVLRIQERVHNKGLVVDSKVVMVSSENWSGDGTLRNRDAGLIIDNQDIAQYFEAIFLDDWTNRATEKIVDRSYPSKAGGPSGGRKGRSSTAPPTKRRGATRRGKT